MRVSVLECDSEGWSLEISEAPISFSIRVTSLLITIGALHNNITIFSAKAHTMILSPIYSY
jgi:hypothetical protein